MGGDHLVEHRRAEVGRLLGHDDPLDNVVLGDDPAEAEARDEGLGEGSHHDHAFRSHRIHRREGLPFETDVLIRCILDDEQVVFAGHIDHIFALFQGHGFTGGVLEVGDGIDKLGLLTGGAEHVAGFGQTVVVAQAVGLATVRPDRLKGCQVGREAADDHVARVDEYAADQVERLLGGGRDHDVLDRDIQILIALVETGNLFAERLDTVRAAILKGGSTFFVEHFLHDALEVFDGEGFRAGETAGKRDDFGAGRHAEEVADLRAAHAQGIF